MSYEAQTVQDARIDMAALSGAVLRRLPRIILVTLVLLAATFAILMFMPRLYESTAGILVEPRSNIYTRSANEQAPSVTGAEAGVVSSQIELIKSRDTLLRVIDQIGLRSVAEFNGGSAGFSPLAMLTQMLGRPSAPNNIDETVLANIYDRLTVIQERDSRIISVIFRSTDPQRAADIANAIAAAHVARRAELSLSDTAEASGWLDAEIQKLRSRVTEAEAAVANFKVDNDLFVGNNNTSLVDQQLSTIATQINAAQERKNAALSRAALIRGLLERGQPIDGVADVRDSAVIQQLSQEKARLQGERAQLSATLLGNHPNIRAADAQINELNNQIAIEGRRVAEALEAEAQIEADVEASLRGDLTTAKTSASTATQDTVTLDSLQREAAAQRNLLEGYLQRYSEAASRTDTNSTLPDVRVVTMAAPAVTPSSPRTQFTLILVGLASLLLQLGLVIFNELISGRAIAPARTLVVQRNQDELDAVPFQEAELEPDQRWEEPEPATAELGPEAAHLIDADEPLHRYSEPVFADEPEHVTLADEAEDNEDEDAEDEDEPVMIEVPVVAQAEPLVPVVVVPVLAAPPPADEAEPEPVASDEDEADVPAPEQVSAEDGHARLRRALLDVAPDLVVEDEPEQQTIPDALAHAYAASHLDTPRLHYRDEKLPDTVAFSDLAADLALGRTRLVILAGLAGHDESAAMAEELVGDALARGLSVALVDAGSARLTEEPGLSDLTNEAASFGEVVHKSADNSFAEVPWGQSPMLDRRSTRPVTLVEALGDIYEVVVLLTGPAGPNSTLPMFEALDGRVILVTASIDNVDQIEQTREQMLEAGFGLVEVASFPEERVAA
ncbi:GumC family protein [Devosia sp. 919]|uniref:GumC family protein n=1 Tax=Devosia sp. 919 TaxID=2726065 RepID=UPI0015571481|nr:GumC family protein [Devosia sp. 919]